VRYGLPDGAVLLFLLSLGACVFMVQALFILLFFQFLGTAVQDGFRLSVPGPVIGMFMLAAWLIGRKQFFRAKHRRAAGSALLEEQEAIPQDLARVARSLIGALGLLFVPAGAGIASQFGLLRANAWPVCVALVGSTLLGLVVTALVMQAMTRGHAPAESLPDNGGQVL
jgi:holin-like protein